MRDLTRIPPEAHVTALALPLRCGVHPASSPQRGVGLQLFSAHKNTFANEVFCETSGHFTRCAQAHPHPCGRLAQPARPLFARSCSRQRLGTHLGEAAPMSTERCDFEVLDKTASSEIEVCRRCGCVAIHVGPVTMRVDLASFDILTESMRRAARTLSQEASLAPLPRTGLLS